MFFRCFSINPKNCQPKELELLLLTPEIYIVINGAKKNKNQKKGIGASLKAHEGTIALWRRRVRRLKANVGEEGRQILYLNGRMDLQGCETIIQTLNSATQFMNGVLQSTELGVLRR